MKLLLCHLSDCRPVSAPTLEDVLTADDPLPFFVEEIQSADNIAVVDPDSGRVLVLKSRDGESGIIYPAIAFANWLLCKAPLVEYAAPAIGATCEESALGFPIYIPCGKPAAFIIKNRNETYPMCDACADHNVRNRGARRALKGEL